MDGQARLEVLHGIFHPDGEPFRFDWDRLAPSGLYTKDFVAPSSPYNRVISVLDFMGRALSEVLSDRK